jgi:hypothetical protein
MFDTNSVRATEIKRHREEIRERERERERETAKRDHYEEKSS